MEGLNIIYEYSLFALKITTADYIYIMFTLRLHYVYDTFTLHFICLQYIAMVTAQQQPQPQQQNNHNCSWAETK